MSRTIQKSLIIAGEGLIVSVPVDAGERFATAAVDVGAYQKSMMVQKSDAIQLGKSSPIGGFCRNAPSRSIDRARLGATV